ncbi:MAG TPA: metallophosphoesterase family protein [Syntrophales bacterium]|nr:metallophosphoesterase family protein [Syntrophales bacterium]
MGKIFVIGDIHGDILKLDRLMAKLDIDAERDTLVFIGDYIDRGPNSRAVIDKILDIRKKIKNVICLLGNHEQMFLNYYLEQRDEELFMHNGGISTLISYGFTREGSKNLKVPEEHMEFLTTLRPYYETDDYIFVHAGLRPGIPVDKQNIDDLIWIRYEFINSPYNFGKVVIFGHTPLSFTEPLTDKNKIGLDTGAVYGGRLTCIELPEMKIYQV